MDDFIATQFKVHFFAPNCSYNCQDAIVLEFVDEVGDKRFALIDGGFGLHLGEKTPKCEHADGSVTYYIDRMNVTDAVRAESRNSHLEFQSYIDALGADDTNVVFYLGTHAHTDHMNCSEELILKYRPKTVYTPMYSDSYIRPETGRYQNSSGQYVTGRNLYDSQFNYDRALEAAKKVGATIVNDLPNDAAAKFSLFGVNFTIVNRCLTINGVDYRKLTGNNRVNDPNDFSWGLLIEGCGRRALLGGDIENNYGQEDKLANQVAAGGKLDLFKLHHHGLATSNSTNLLGKVLDNKGVAVCPGTNAWPNLTLLNKLTTMRTRLFSTEDARQRGMQSIVVTLDANGVSTNFDGFVQGRVTKNGKLLYSNGLWCGISGKPGWVTDASTGKRYYHHGGSFTDTKYTANAGFYTEGWRQIDGLYYYFASDGPRGYATSDFWVKYGGYWYHIGDDNTVDTNKWVLYKNKYYRLKGDGKCACSEMLTIDGAKYLFNSNGTVYTGWSKQGGYWYWFNTTYDTSKRGKAVTGLNKINGYWYHFNSAARMLTGWQQVNGKWYYFDPTNGNAIASAWRKLNGYWYYFNADGVMQTGLVLYNGAIYALKSSGAMRTGTVTVSNYTLTFHSSNGNLAKMVNNSTRKTINLTASNAVSVFNELSKIPLSTLLAKL